MKNKTWRSCHSPRFPYLSFLLSHRLFRSSPAMNHEALRGQPFYGQASISINHAYVLVWVHFMVDSSVSCSFVMYWCWACDRYTRTNSLLLHLVDLVTSVLTNVFTFLTFPYEKSFGIVFSGQKSENVLWPLCHRILKGISIRGAFYCLCGKDASAVYSNSWIRAARESKASKKCQTWSWRGSWSCHAEWLQFSTFFQAL